MASNALSAVRLGMEVNNITLAHFTEESVTQFLHYIADTVENRVVKQAGASPWFPNMDSDLPGSVRVPADDGGDPFVFNLFTNPAVTRAVTAADPANLVDVAALMRQAADEGNDLQRLAFLRIAARWNYSMNLQGENRLIYDPNSAPLPGDYDDNQTGMVSPTRTIARTRVVHDDDGLAVVEQASGERHPAGRFADTTAQDGGDDAAPTIDL